MQTTLRPPPFINPEIRFTPKKNSEYLKMKQTLSIHNVCQSEAVLVQEH